MYGGWRVEGGNPVLRTLLRTYEVQLYIFVFTTPLYEVPPDMCASRLANYKLERHYSSKKTSIVRNRCLVSGAGAINQASPSVGPEATT